MKFKLTIAFDGTNYAGWQVQKTGLGVQQRIEEALPKGLSEADEKTFRANWDRLSKRIDVARTIVQGTNVPDAVGAVHCVKLSGLVTRPVTVALPVAAAVAFAVVRGRLLSVGRGDDGAMRKHGRCKHRLVSRMR